MEKVIKLNAINSAPYTNQNNIIEFEVPSGVWDLSDSYININCRIDVTESETVSGVGVYPMSLRWGATPLGKIPNVVLVRDARVTCDNKGMLEDLHRVDQLKIALKNSTNHNYRTQDTNYLDMCPFADPQDGFNNEKSLFREFNKLGGVKSRPLDICPISIALSDIFDCCSTPEFDTNRAGNMRIRLRCNINRLVAEQNESECFDGSDYQGTLQDLDDTTDGKTFVTNALYTDLASIPYYVGQKLLFTSTGGDVIESDKPAVINSVEWDRTVGSGGIGRVTITTEELPFTALTAGQTITGITVDQELIDSATVSYDNAEIVLKSVDSPTNSDGFSYNTYSLEQTSPNGANPFNKMYLVEPEAENIIILGIDSSGLFQEKMDSVLSYHIRCNNESMSDNRDVLNLSPLWNEKKRQIFANMDMPVNNWDYSVGQLVSTYQDRYAVADSSRMQIMGSPLPKTTEQKQVALELNSQGANAEIVSLSAFKHLPREFRY